MATWQEFESAAPEIAAGGHKLIFQFGPGLAFMATVRADGAPRLHPICPTIVGGRLFGCIGKSPKRGDLRRDGRFALHTFPPTEVDDEFCVSGRAKLIDDEALRETVVADLKGRGVNTQPGEELFEFLIDRAMLAAYPGGHGTWPPKYSVWKERRVRGAACIGGAIRL